MQASTSEKSISLVQLVLSDYCKDNYLVDYLHQHLHSGEVLEAIFLKLSHLPERRLLDVLPNVICIFSRTKSKQIEKFLYRLCEKSHTIYLITRWAFRAYNEDAHNEQVFEAILNNMDSATMNKNQFDLLEVPENLLQASTLRPIQGISEYVEQKDHESIRTLLTNQFYSHLTNITLRLKDSLPCDRENRMRVMLEMYYERFLSEIGNRASRCLPGMYFPIPSASNFIVGLDYEHCLVFSTKMRVPYKLVFETVNHEELMNCEKEKQELTKSVYKAMAVQRTQIDNDCAKENEENSRMQKETAMRINEYMKMYGNTEEDKIEVSYLKNNQEYFDEAWKEKVAKIIEQSPYNGMKSHRIRSYMVKGGDDLTQEFFAMQLIKLTYKIFRESGLKIWLKPYDIVIFTKNSGFIQFLPDTMTVSSLKKNGGSSLKSIYKHLFGERLDHAIKNFTLSLAGYSIVQYIFQIKDRHNGNIMVDSEGHIIHIDFGFLLGSSPGNVNFEKAPFKLTADYIELMEGTTSQYFTFFREMLFMGFSFLKGYIKDMVSLIEVTREKSNLPCFWYYREKDIRYRMMEGSTDEEIRKRIDALLYESGNSYYSRHYDRFQWYTNGIHK